MECTALDIKRLFVSAGVPLPPAAVYLITALRETPGEIVALERLMIRLANYSGNAVSEDGTRKAVQHARKALTKTDWGWKIVNHHSFGYQLLGV